MNAYLLLSIYDIIFGGFLCFIHAIKLSLGPQFEPHTLFTHLKKIVSIYIKLANLLS